MSSTQAARERSRHGATNEGKAKGSKGESRKGRFFLHARYVRPMQWNKAIHKKMITRRTSKKILTDF